MRPKASKGGGLQMLIITISVDICLWTILPYSYSATEHPIARQWGYEGLAKELEPQMGSTWNVEIGIQIPL